MNRRAALWLTMLMGGLAPARLLGQQISGRRVASPGRIRAVSDEFEADPNDATRSRARRAVASDDPLDTDPLSNSTRDEEPPADFASEPGRQWKTLPINTYTSLPHKGTVPPQSAIVNWIFRRSGTGVWHDDKIAALSASKTRIAAYHANSVLKQVTEVVERFTDAVSNVLSVRVQVVAAADTRWRYLQFARLNLIGSGPQGQRIWTLPPEVATQLVIRMQDTAGFVSLADQTVSLINGQTLTFETFESRPFNGGLQRDNGAGLGYQPKAESLKEGVEMRFSPLLTYDGDAVDAAIEMTASTVRKLHFTRVLAPREVGPNETTVEIPEVSSTRMNQTVKNWPLNQALLISAGILPGVLHPNKNGFLNLRLPGTIPTTTELLIFLRVDTVERGRTARN